MKSKYKIKISGRNINYFLNTLISKGVFFELIDKDRKNLIILVDEGNYTIIKNIKTSYKISIINFYGFNHIKSIFKQYYSFIISFFICIILLVITSNFIFNIQINSNNEKLVKIIREDLKVRGVSKYKFKKNYKEREKIISEIVKEENNNIEWLEINSVGTRYIVNILERKKNNIENKCLPSNIVASKDAIIVNIEAISGEVKTSINQSVKKGDVLISGNIFNKDEIVNSKCSRGKVIGEVWYQVYVDLPIHYYEENVTGKVERKIEFLFFNHKSSSSYKTYKSKNIDILSNKILPIRLSYVEYYETKVINKKFNIDNVDKFAINKATNKLNKKLKLEDKIVLKKILKKEQKNSRIIVGVFFKVYEDISKEELITNGDDENDRASQ